ncbi:unnamed protein product [Penicillium pancosmium]
MAWDVADCSERFNTLARRIFSQRRPSVLPSLLHPISGYKSVIGEAAKWIQWLLHDSCYDSRVFDATLKDAFGETRCLFGANEERTRVPLRSGVKVGVGIGTFQDGGLKYNFAGDLANRVSNQIWPSSMGSIRMLSLGTGKAQPNDHTPHFRHIFRDGFLRRGFDAWMSTMETDSDWKKWRVRLGCEVRGDCHRLDVSLGQAPQTIDAVDTMDDYRDIVLLQSGSARMAREAATTLLVSRFFFVVGSLPERTASPFWCSGSVRCKGPAKKIIAALEQLYPEGLSYVSDSGVIADFGGLDSFCASCGCYNRPISLLTRHLDHTVNVYIQNGSKRKWRISGFPETIATFALRQGLDMPFGREDHGYPCREPCHRCDATGCATKGKRRRRQSETSEGAVSRKRAHA